MRPLAGFTLIELLVVIAIIGILSATVLASLGSARARSQTARTLAELREVSVASERLFLQSGLYPHKQSAVCPPVSASNNEINLSTSAAGLTSTDGTYLNWKGPYIFSVPDPLGTPYFLDQDYQCDAASEGCNGVDFSGSNHTSALISCGPDRLLDATTNGGACAYNSDNIIRVYCQL